MTNRIDRFKIFCLGLISASMFSLYAETLESIFSDLQKGHVIRPQPLPIVYNTHFMVGYLNMPSAFSAEEGESAVGYAYFYPYQNFGVNFQLFSFLETAFNYKVFLDQAEENFGQYGFGDDADRMANFKFFFDPSRYFSGNFPKFAFGIDDFYGSQRFFAPYAVMTMLHRDLGLEWSFGWGFHRMKGPFFGFNYSPFFRSSSAFLRGSTLILEYDAIDYKNYEKEHSLGKEVYSRWNIGYQLRFLDLIDIKVATNRGKELLVQGDLHYNFGETLGLFPKVSDPNYYRFPRNLQSMGYLRSERQAAADFAEALGTQGFYVTQIFLVSEEENQQSLQIELINLRYWRNEEVKKRISAVVKNLYPKNLSSVVITISENSIPVESYRFSLESLEESPTIEEAVSPPSRFDGKKLFYRKKTVASWLIRPRLLSFFGSVSGKYKYALSLIGGPQGYLFDRLYYKILLSYNIKSSIQNLSDIDYYDPSQLLVVRTDSVRYFQTQTGSLEQAYLQRGWNLGKGFYFRTAFGYFEPAYAGAALEGLYFPVHSSFAFGIEAATVLKRNYEGLGFQWKVRKLNQGKVEFVPFVGVQYFLDAYYYVKRFDLEFKVSVGQFLAKDRGVGLDIAKYYPSGLRVGYWMTITNAQDTVHNQVYFNKGISFRMPLDIFLTKSSRNYLGTGIAFWLRDSGAKAATGKELYPTLIRAREY